MREAISNTAELGALLGGLRIVDDEIRARMAEVLDEVRRGQFAQELRSEKASGYRRLEAARDGARKATLEKTFRNLRETEE